jgi:hypothetical protein
MLNATELPSICFSDPVKIDRYDTATIDRDGDLGIFSQNNKKPQLLLVGVIVIILQIVILFK